MLLKKKINKRFGCLTRELCVRIVRSVYDSVNNDNSLDWQKLTTLSVFVG